MKRSDKLLLIPVVLGTMHGCGTGLLSDTVGEGVIEYAMSFPDYDPNGIMAGMLPERTTLTFTEDKQVAELSAGMGIFRTSMITNDEAEAMDYHLSLMGKKIVAHMLPRDLDLFNEETSKPTILYTGDVDTIAGYPCKRAIAIFDRVEEPEIELWYTDQITMKNPNWFGPFAEVPGVLLRYEMVQYGMRMRLDAVSVTPGEVDPGVFDRKAEFEQVPAAVLHHELAEVLGTFSM
ncbi:MAG: DUF4412 domain-containing protein [Flavobacteriales bacterium]|nr:hypothetical protein [Flavobacteriales bacterium]